MDQRREFVRLAAQEGANRRELCRRFGISPETGYKWLRRATADDGSLTDASRMLWSVAGTVSHSAGHVRSAGAGVEGAAGSADADAAFAGLVSAWSGATTSGFSCGGVGAIGRLAGSSRPWTLAQAFALENRFLRSEAMITIEHLADHFGPLPPGPWSIRG